MIEFFFGFLLVLIPGETVPMFDYVTFSTHGQCSSAIQSIEQNLKITMPEGTEIRVSCVSSESIGQNSV